MSDSTTANHNHRSAAEIERDVERSRAQVENTLDQLRDRTSPGQLFEQALDYARRSGGPEFARNLGEQVRDNPLPVLLIGSGIAWLMMSGNRQHHSHARPLYGPASATPSAGPYPTATPGLGSGSEHHASMHHATSGDGPSLTERASATAGEARNRMGAAAGAARDSLAGTAHQAGEAASSAYQGAADAAGSMAHGISSAASSVGHQLADARHYARDQAGNLGGLMREQPLLLGAVGLALGAVIGALLPTTETEDRLMGETRDTLAERTREAAQEGYDRVRNTAGEHLERARAATGEAHSIGRVGEAVGQAAHEVREAVRDAAHDVASEAHEALGSKDEGARAGERKNELRREDRPGTIPTGPSPTAGPMGPATGPGRANPV